MCWKTKDRSGCFVLSESIEIDEPVDRAFARWTRYEDFPRFMESVRRTKCIDEQRVLWDIDIAGYQVVWEARIVEALPGKRVQWESSWGAVNAGEVRFEALSSSRTRLCVEIAYRPKGFLEQLGARVGLTDLHVRRDLACFRHFAEHLPVDAL